MLLDETSRDGVVCILQDISNSIEFDTMEYRDTDRDITFEEIRTKISDYHKKLDFLYKMIGKMEESSNE